MSRGQGYQQISTSRTDHEYDDEDLEIGLHELGPIETPTLAQNAWQPDPRTANNIPLRQLLPHPLSQPAKGAYSPLDGSAPSRTLANPLDLEDDDGLRIDIDGEVEGDGTPLLPRTSPSHLKRAGSATPSIIDRFSSAVRPRIGLEENGKPQSNGVDAKPRTFRLGQYPPPAFPPNTISNAKYTPWSFFPRLLYQEFSFFLNMYFLLVALSQLIPPLKIGQLWTYMFPLAFVLSITLGKEAYDDIIRRRRDAEANRELFTILRLRDITRSVGKTGGRKTGKGRDRVMSNAMEEQNIENVEVQTQRIRSQDIKVGDVLRLGKDQRVPADMVILQVHGSEIIEDVVQPQVNEHLDHDSEAGGSDETSKKESESSGETFVRTDQLDGETDWKLRIASPLTQSLRLIDLLRISVTAAAPSKQVNEFTGTLTLEKEILFDYKNDNTQSEPDTKAALSIDNTAWANTVIASGGIVYGAVVYTGRETRQALSTSSPRSKVGLLELEINNLTKFLCILTLGLCGLLAGLQQLEGDNTAKWYISIFRFLILFSSIIPISLRVNLDLGKTVYAYFIHRDASIAGAVVRTSTIPEDLGRIEYLLSDKTGTLTQNEMDLRKVHIGTVSYASEAMDEITAYVRQGFANGASNRIGGERQLVTPNSLLNTAGAVSAARTRREVSARIRDLVLALALCHNVTPTTETVGGIETVSYQASSPDEIAIVKWTESVGLRVVRRDRHMIALQAVATGETCVKVKILELFPFTSEGKRMGIIVQFIEGSEDDETDSQEIWFYQKGADTVMAKIVAANDWLDEETTNMAREGLRTLVVGRRRLSPEQYADFSYAYKQATTSIQDRDLAVAEVVGRHLEHDLEILGITGVEDKLQHDVKPSLELLRNAGIKIWMLTGDKVETARCVAISAKLVSRNQRIQTITALRKSSTTNPTAASDALALLASTPETTALLIDGDSLSYLLENNRDAFITVAVLLPAVIACRCSPTQKAEVALLIRAYTKKRVACIGDGGNDVSMIQAADVGVGIAGKEGQQASLAADFSITQFHHLTKLLVWHGRNSYKRSAKLAQFVIHRGLIISVAQSVYSIAAKFTPEGLFRNWLLIAYGTIYTQFPVFSFVLDTDVDESLANLYPELYKELTAGSSLSYRTFLGWCLVSLYQGAIIQVLSQLLVGAITAPADSTGGESGVINPDPRMLAVAYTALLMNELLMVAINITTWQILMAVAIWLTIAIYAASIPFLGDYYDLVFVWSPGFLWRVSAILVISILPVWGVRAVTRIWKPPSYRKVRGG